LDHYSCYIDNNKCLECLKLEDFVCCQGIKR
jgi:hypothetical protein